MDGYERIRDLPLSVESYGLEALKRTVSSRFERFTTVIELRGGGERGCGEDVTYEAGDQVALQQAGPGLPLAGEYTLDGFSRRLDELDLFPRPPASDASRHYRRWAFESAALDLALRQAGTSLASVLGVAPRPVRFVVSLRLGEPPTARPVLVLLERRPGLRFKLDATSAWDDALVRELAGTGAVEAVDLKGAYRGTAVDQGADAALYARVASGFPDAWIEDPALDERTDEVLRPHRRRIAWDAPIHSVADIEALPFPPGAINVKPSRFGTLRELLAAYEHCRVRGIPCYGGGQFELGPGRGQIQYLASLFHPDAPNDVAPGGYNDPEPAADLPGSPLAPRLAPLGFRWEGR